MASAKVSGSGLCGPLGLSWLRPEGGPPSLAICFTPWPLVADRQGHLDQSGPDVLWERARLSPGMTPKLCHTLLSFRQKCYPFSELSPFVLQGLGPAWPASSPPCLSGPPWPATSERLLPWLCLPALAWVPGLIPSARWGLGPSPGPRQRV